MVPPGDSGCSKLPGVSAGSRNEDECQLPDCITSPGFSKNEFPSVQLHPQDETSSTGANVSGGGGQMVGNKTGVGSAEHSSEKPILQGQCQQRGVPQKDQTSKKVIQDATRSDGTGHTGLLQSWKAVQAPLL